MVQLISEELSDEEIITLDKQLHYYYNNWQETFGYTKEELEKWHRTILAEMDKRGLPHEIVDHLMLLTSDQEPTWKSYEFPEEIMVEANAVRLIGDTVENFEQPNTTDMLLSKPDLEFPIIDTFKNFSPSVDVVIGKVLSPNVPIYNLVLKRVDKMELLLPEKACWTKAPWVASKGKEKVELSIDTDLTTTSGLHKLSESLDVGSWDVIRGNIHYVVDKASDHLVVRYPDGSYKQVLLEEDIYLRQPLKTQQYVWENYNDYGILRLTTDHDELSWTIQSDLLNPKPFALATMGAHSSDSTATKSGKALLGKQLPDFHEYYLSGHGRVVFGLVNGVWRFNSPRDQIPWYYHQLEENDFSKISAYDEFMASKISKTFKIDIPSGQYPSQTTLLGAKSNIKFIKKGEVLLIDGIALAQGTWRGIDLKTIFYPFEVLDQAAPSLLQVQLKLQHKGRDIDVKGFVSRVWTDEANKCIWVRLMIFDQATIVLLLSSADEFGLSVEGYCIKLDRSKSPFVAQQIAFTMIVLTDDPACKVCKVDPSSMEVRTLE